MFRNSSGFILVVFLVAVLLSACAPPAPARPQLSIEDPWIRAAAMLGMPEGEMQGESGEMMGGSGMTAAYMTIRNSGQGADRLISIETDVAEVVETHISEERNGVMMMSPVEGIDLPGRTTVTLEPGGLHIMLINLKQDLNPEDQVTLRLNFVNSAPMEISVPVRSP